GPVLDLAHVIAAARTRNPAVLLNGSRVCPRYARLPGMTVEREALPGCKPPKAAPTAAGRARDCGPPVVRRPRGAPAAKGGDAPRERKSNHPPAKSGSPTNPSKPLLRDVTFHAR